MIECITDPGIRKIMIKHLKKFNEERGGKIIEHPELAFHPMDWMKLNKNIWNSMEANFVSLYIR